LRLSLTDEVEHLHSDNRPPRLPCDGLALHALVVATAMNAAARTVVRRLEQALRELASWDHPAEIPGRMEPGVTGHCSRFWR